MPIYQFVEVRTIYYEIEADTADAAGQQQWTDDQIVDASTDRAMLVCRDCQDDIDDVPDRPGYCLDCWSQLPVCDECHTTIIDDTCPRCDQPQDATNPNQLTRGDPHA